MAVSKIHPIRKTLSKSFDYILDPAKTSNDLYVSSFRCAPPIATEEFLMTKRRGNESCTTLAQHLIQSFKPGEVSSEVAHEIGKKLIDRLTNSEHQYVIATHVDKGHVHNHIIFNHTNFVTYKAFRSNINTVKEIRRINDELCKEYGLSVIGKPKKKGMSKYEWMMRRKGLSYKKLLQDNIDICISSSNSFEEFLLNMQKLGYEIKHGKHIAFRKNDKERFVRAKSFGHDYCEESIKERIRLHPPVYKISHFVQDMSLGLIKNMENYMAYVNNPVYKQKVALTNTKKLAATYNYLVSHNIDSLEQLDLYFKSTKDDYKSDHDSLRKLEEQLEENKDLLYHMTRLKDNEDVYKKYKVSVKPEEFRERHRAEIMIYEASLSIVRKHIQFNQVPSISTLNKTIHELQQSKNDLYADVKLKKEKVKELETVKKNIDIIFKEKEPRRRERDLER